jgi:GNAT superfamily N-acetyltransferase
MISIKKTDGRDKDFILLCRQLDDYLNALVGGEANRAEYVGHNALDDIHNVWVAYEGEVPVGCAAYKEKTAQAAEIKRVFVRQDYRRKGIAKALFVELENTARLCGYQRLILETGEPLQAAMRMYLAMGYYVIDNYEPYVNMPESICLGKTL